MIKLTIATIECPKEVLHKFWQSESAHFLVEWHSSSQARQQLHQVN